MVKDIEAEDMTVGHHHRNIRVKGTNLIQELRTPWFLRSENRNSDSHGYFFDRGRGELPPPALRFVGLGHHSDHLVPFSPQPHEGVESEEGSPPEQDLQEATSS